MIHTDIRKILLIPEVIPIPIYEIFKLTPEVIPIRIFELVFSNWYYTDIIPISLEFHANTDTNIRISFHTDTDIRFSIIPIHKIHTDTDIFFWYRYKYRYRWNTRKMHPWTWLDRNDWTETDRVLWVFSTGSQRTSYSLQTGLCSTGWRMMSRKNASSNFVKQPGLNQDR